MKDNLPPMSEICKRYPEIKFEDIEMLWHCGYYDGPLNGMAELNGERLWFQMLEEAMTIEPWGFQEDEVDPVSIWYYGLFKLTPEQQYSEEYWHELFRICVGRHTDYRNGKRGTFTDLRSGNDATMKFFYHRSKEERTEVVLDESQLVGWYKW